MSPLEGVMEAVMDTDVVPLEGALEVEMDTNPPQAPPKLRGLNPNEPAYKLLLCPHGKPGNGWFCGEAGCSGRGLCEHKKQKQMCRQCKPVQCHLCNNGRIYAWGNMRAHIYNTMLHANVSGEDRFTAYWDAGVRGGYVRVMGE